MNHRNDYSHDEASSGMSGSGAQFKMDGDVAISDFDASLFGTLSMDCNLIPGNSVSYVDSLSAGMPDELNLGELESLMNAASAGDYSLSFMPSSVECGLPNANALVTNNCQQSRVVMPNSTGNVVPQVSAMAQPPRSSHPALRRMLTDTQPSPQSNNVRPSGDLALSGGSQQDRDVNKMLLQLVLRQQMQQNEQQRILERLQNALLSGDADQSAATSTATSALPVPPKTVSNATCSLNMSATTAKSNANQDQLRTGHIQALLEASPPAPTSSAAMQQYAHLSQSELRQALLSTDYQQQQKRGANVKSASANSTASTTTASQQPVRASSVSASCTPSTSWQPLPLNSLPQSSVSVKTSFAAMDAADDRLFGNTSSAFASAIDADSDDNADDSFSQLAANTGSSMCTTRRSAHNVIEKRYRSSINDRIDELRQLVAGGTKMHKSGILRKTLDCIHHLRSQNVALRNENAALRRALLGTNETPVDSETLIPADSPAALDCTAQTNESSVPAVDVKPRVNGHVNATGRSQMLLCVALLTFVASNPLELFAARLSTWNNPSTRSPLYRHMHVDYNEPHIGARILNSFMVDSELREARHAATDLSMALITFIWLVNIAVLYFAARFASYCYKRKDSKSSNSKFTKLKATGDQLWTTELLHNVWTVVPIEASQLCEVYSRLLLCKTASSNWRVTCRVAISALRNLPRCKATFKDQAAVSNVYMTVAYATLRHANSSPKVLAIFLHCVATYAIRCERKMNCKSVFNVDRFADFLSISASRNEHENLVYSLTQTLLVSYCRALLDESTVALRDRNTLAIRRSRHEWCLLEQAAEGTALIAEVSFWHTATDLFAEFDSHWRRPCEKSSRLSQPISLQTVERLANLPVIQNGALCIASSRTACLAYQVHRTIRLFLSISSTQQLHESALHGMSSAMNTLSHRLQCIRDGTEVDSLELNVASCSARWLLTLRMHFYAMHQELQDAELRKAINRKRVGEYQTDLDTFMELNERQLQQWQSRQCKQETCVSDEADLANFKAFLHELANSNPVRNVFTRLRVFAS